MRGTTRTPSVLGGYRPQVRDPGRDANARVQYLEAEVETAQAKLDKAKSQLAAAKAERESMRRACGKCKNCSACLG